MNERIKQLWDDAALQTGDKSNAWDDQVAFMSLFAELIVRECMEQVWYTREDGINGNVSEVIKQRMKEHFGVE